MLKSLPKKWWDEKYREARAGLRKAHADWSAERLDEATRGRVGEIWHNSMAPAEREARTRKAEKMYPILRKAGFAPRWVSHLTKQFLHKDFGGWTSHNLDWERGYREGERKAED